MLHREGKSNNPPALSALRSVSAVAIVIGCMTIVCGIFILAQRIVDASESTRSVLPDVTCDQFETWDAANHYFTSLGTDSDSTHGLDSNGNGVPCEYMMPRERAIHEEFDVICNDFQHRDEAEYFLEQYSEPNIDLYGLDRDLDNRPCETLPPLDDIRRVLNRLNRLWYQDVSIGHDMDCSDFQTWAEANAFFVEAGGPGSDPHRLDGNNDGVPCETLPGAPR